MFEQDMADAFAAAALNRRHSWTEHSDAAFQLALALVGASAKSKDLSAALAHVGNGCLAAIDPVRPLWSCVALVLGFIEANVPCDYLLRRVVDVALQRPLELPTHAIVALVRAFVRVQGGAADSRDRARVEKLASTCLLRFREMDIQDFRALVEIKSVCSLNVIRKMLLQYLCCVMPNITPQSFQSMLEEFVSVADSSSFDAVWQQLFALLQDRRSLQWSSSDLAHVCVVLHSCSERGGVGNHVSTFAFACAKHVSSEVSLCNDQGLCRFAVLRVRVCVVPGVSSRACGSAIALCEALGFPHELAAAIGSEASKRLQGGAARDLIIEDSVAAMQQYVKHKGARPAAVAAESMEAASPRSASHGWSPRANAVVK
jgi:hypothetical protein